MSEQGGGGGEQGRAPFLSWVDPEAVRRAGPVASEPGARGGPRGDPFITQIDPVARHGFNNCGPATLAMLLADEGLVPATYEGMLGVADRVRDGVPDNVGQFWGTYTTFTQLIAQANRYGRGTRWHADYDSVHASLAEGQAVCLLLYNAPLSPRQYPGGPAFDANHFILLDGHEGDTYLVNDPLRTYAPVGPGRYDGWSLREGVRRVGGVQAFSLVPQHAPVEDDEMALTPDERTALEQLRALSWGAQSITDAITRLGAYEHEVVPALTAERDQLNGINTELQRQVNALREEVGVVKAENAAGAAERDDLARAVAALQEHAVGMRGAIEGMSLTWADGVTAPYLVAPGDASAALASARPRRSP